MAKSGLLFLLFLLCGWANAQSIQQNKALSEATALYNEAVGHNSRLFNGSEANVFHQWVQGHPFYLSSYEKGSITYWDRSYEEVFLKYDLYHDEVLTEHYDLDGSFVNLALQSDQITGFTIDKAKFIRIGNEYEQLSAGFYQLLFSDYCLLVLKHKKDKQQVKDFRGPKTMFVSAKDLYLVLDSTVTLIKRPGQLIKAHPDFTKEMKRFYRQHHLAWTDNKALLSLALVKYYQKLKTGNPQ